MIVVVEVKQGAVHIEHNGFYLIPINHCFKFLCISSVSEEGDLVIIVILTDTDPHNTRSVVVIRADFLSVNKKCLP